MAQLLSSPEDFTSADWTKTRSSITGNSIVAPDGTTTVDTLREDGTAGNTHLVSQTVTALTSGIAHTFSCFLRNTANRQWLRLTDATTTGSPDVWFNSSTGEIGTEVNSTGIAENFGDFWRFAITHTITSTSVAWQIYIGEADGDVVFNGQNQDSLYVWGAWLNEGSTPDQYVSQAGIKLPIVAGGRPGVGFSLGKMGGMGA